MIAALFLGLVGGWAIVVFLSGRGTNLTGVEWDFHRVGELGDSFGVVGALMATAAAAFTFLTLRDERAENARLRKREDDRDRADRKREAEATFFQLLNLRNDILERIRDPRQPASATPVKGSMAIEFITKILTKNVLPCNESSQSNYDSAWSKVEGELGHCLRFTYHIIRFVVSNFDNDYEIYAYVRLLRAQLSNAETQLIAVNSIFGEGKPKMEVYINQFSLMHNLPEDIINRLKLKDHFEKTAFDSSGWQATSPEKSN
ncbi:putative phage abortive infection protein [Novosphingobium colocasiae]|uniref:putative phage abortive infection protein n=1 Tax=Novosphingobium colocasiae TaxID=1256513 RepID=UPI0035B02E2D